MPQATNDIVEVTLIGDMQNQQVTNVTHWHKTDNTHPSEDIAEQCASAFIQGVLPNVASAYTLTEVQYRNLFDPSDSGTIDVLDQVGGQAVEALPPHDTCSAQLLHDEPAIRNGRKGFAGVPETSQVNGLVTPAHVTSWDNGVSSFITEALKDVATNTIDIAQPVIVKRISEVVGAVTRYRLPQSVVEAVVGFVYDIVIDTYVRTQNSRKVGRGS